MNYLAAVDDCFLDFPGGMARVAWDVALEMRERGHTVALLCAKRSDDLPDESNQDGIRVVRYQRPSTPGWHPLRARRTIDAASERARAAFSGERFDIVHMHSTFTGLGAIAAFGHGPRYVYTMHSPMVLEQRINWSSQGIPGRIKLLFGQGRLRRIERAVLEPCIAVQTLSDYTRRQLEAFHGLASRATIVPHWRRDSDRRTLTREEARRRLGWRVEERVLFTLRRHGPRYGLDLAIRAAAPLLESFESRLIVAGDGPLRPKFEALARQLGIADRVVFPGRISDEQLALAYQAADLFILPTLALECFGLIILEAFSYGCPVLASDVCAIPETMRPIMPEFLFPAGNIDVLRDRLKSFLEGRLVPPSPETLVHHVESHYSREVVLPRLLGLLEGDILASCSA